MALETAMPSDPRQHWPRWCISHGRSHFAVTLVALQLSSASGTLQSQQVRVITDDVSCRTCRIEIGARTPLHAPAQALLNSPPNAAVSDAGGQIWLVPDEGPPVIFAAGGAFVSVVGRQGSGPGEFSVPIGLLRVGDSVVVFDAGTSRASVLDKGIRLTRSVNLTATVSPGVAIRWPENVVFTGFQPTPESAGWPLHAVTLAGRDQRLRFSFGPDEGQVAYGREVLLSLLFANSRGEHYWSADRYQYRLIRWNSSHERRGTIVRQSKWFPTSDRTGMGNATTPPPPAISAIHEDASGLIWVFARVASPTWSQAWTNVQRDGREILYRSIAVEKLFRTVIEVIDPARGRVVTRAELPYLVTHVLSDTLALAFHNGEGTDEPVVSVVRFDLQRP